MQFFWRFWGGGVLKVVSDTLQVTAPLVTKALIQFGSNAYYARQGVPGVADPSVGRGIGLVFGLWAMLVFSSLCLHQVRSRTKSCRPHELTTGSSS
jgi:hypothetical protein